MTRSLIYLIAIFALWLYFTYGNFSSDEKTVPGGGGTYGGGGGRDGKTTIKEADNAQSGFGGKRA